MIGERNWKFKLNNNYILKDCNFLFRFIFVFMCSLYTAAKILHNFKRDANKEKTVLSVFFHIGAPNLMPEATK